MPTQLPRWAETLRDAHESGTAQMFVLHGNLHDLARVERPGEISYVMVPEFLSAQLFGRWDAVLLYDQVHGPRALATTPQRVSKINQHVEQWLGPVEELRQTREAGKVLAVLNRYLELALLREGERPSVALILDYAHFLAPSTSVAYTSRELASSLATLLNWAKSPYFKRAPFAFCLLSEKLSDLNESLVQNPHTFKIEIPYPDRDERLRFIEWLSAGRDFDTLSENAREQLAELTAGLTLVHLQGLLQRPLKTGQKLTQTELKINKKRLIEGQCQGLVEFVEPAITLDLVVGHEEAKRQLQKDAEFLRQGQLSVVPMGYLVCGPVGTGKTFLAECYAGSVGTPCLKLLNFRSKYVGETEGNLEKILKVLRVMGPVVVIIDEADAMLGDRDTSGDSGTSSRVFGQFAAQMGNTQYRGRIIWFLLTCRPDLLPIDIKRQGRCEVHIPLFYPHEPAEISAMFLTMARKNRIEIPPEDLPEIPKGLKLSGADIEGIVTRARREALIDGASRPSKAHLQRMLDEFLPAVEGDEKELQVIAATLECTDRGFFPEEFRTILSSPEGRTGLLRKYRELKLSLG